MILIYNSNNQRKTRGKRRKKKNNSSNTTVIATRSQFIYANDSNLIYTILYVCYNSINAEAHIGICI